MKCDVCNKKTEITKRIEVPRENPVYGFQSILPNFKYVCPSCHSDYTETKGDNELAVMGYYER